MTALTRDFSPYHQFLLEGFVHKTSLLSLALVRLSRVFTVAHFPEMLVLGEFSTVFLNCKDQRAKGTVCVPRIAISVLLSPLSSAHSKNQTL